MRALVVGATGATGRLLVEELLRREVEVRVIVRSADRLPESVRDHASLEVTEASLLDLSDEELQRQIEGCQAVASCLGHNLTIKGIYGKPRRLVTEATVRLCAAIRAKSPDKSTKFALMNTTGNQNLDLDEHRSFGERVVMGLVRLLIPPQPDNEQAAEHLRTTIGNEDPSVEWVAVRPDSLIDEEEVTEYELHPSPTRSPVFNAGKTSRINVAHFMACLLTEDTTWAAWKGQMPVVYNKPSSLARKVNRAPVS